MSDGRVVDQTSLWLCAPPSRTTVARGKVIDQYKRPVAGAKVSFNGRSNRTDSNGGFNIPDIATLGIEKIQAEATFLQPYGSIMRMSGGSRRPGRRDQSESDQDQRHRTTVAVPQPDQRQPRLECAARQT